MSIKIMTRVWQQSQQQGSSLVVLLAIADFANDSGEAYPSVATLAQKARVSESQIHWILRKLQEEGELEVERNAGPHRCNLYKLLGPQAIRAVFRTAFPPDEEITDNRVQSSEGAADNKKRVRPVAPDPSIDPSEPPSGPSDSSDSSESSESSVPTGGILPKRITSKITEHFMTWLLMNYPTLDVDKEVKRAMSRSNYAKTSDKQGYIMDWLDRGIKFQGEQRAPPSSAAPPRGAQRAEPRRDRDDYPDKF